ncbi:MAG TPA: HEPN domain-containing protein [Spirochaetota bacterium]|nr:HEPN domain-containing protein [Spirochaetota bacterium]HQP49809.1 HEPN domain-containing protein [Spirochaetota bacterium]
MKPHEEWLYKAGNDLDSAKYLLSSPKPLFDIAIYHTQQCAEKSLKAFLAYNAREIDKIHNLKMLAENCMAIDETFNDLIDDCIYLNPYATLYRYPDGDSMPSKATVIEAISVSEKIYNFTRGKINVNS